MKSYQISINQVPIFGQATEAARRTIIKEHITPFIPKATWYRLTKARAKKYFELRDITLIDRGVAQLRKKKPEKPTDIQKRDADIAGLILFKEVSIPSIFKNLTYEIITHPNKTLRLEGVDILVAPDVMFRAVIKGKSVLGGIKFHTVKGSPYELRQAQDVSTIVYHFLKKHVATTADTVKPELCFCFDLFSKRFVPATREADLSRVSKSCIELKKLWDKIVTIEINDLAVTNPIVPTLVNLAIHKPEKDPKDPHWILNFWPAKFSEANYFLTKQNISYKKL